MGLKKILLYIFISFVLLLTIFSCYIYCSFPYRSYLECNIAETQLKRFINISLPYFQLETNDFKSYVNIADKSYETDVWGNKCLLQKSKDKVILRSFGKNGINNKGSVDDITVTVEKRKYGLFRTSEISGYTKFKYWEILPKSWRTNSCFYDAGYKEKKIVEY